jgi:UPF0176 protein
MKEVVAFYRFVPPTGIAQNRLLALQQQLRALCVQQDILGTVLLAPEGINGTITGERSALEVALDFLRAQSEFADLESKFSPVRDDAPVFYRLRIKLKPQILSFGPTVAPSEQTGEHVDAQRWNELLNDPDVVVVDTRNAYEVELGSFPGALDPRTTSFRDFPEFVAQQLDPSTAPRVAMFCTGGIRCEKASSFLLAQGFAEVYQLDGGILKYLETVDPAENRWQGECFVFDQRVSINTDLAPGEHVQCHACRRALAPADLEHRSYVEGVSCGYCVASATAAQRAGFTERQRQIELAAQRGEVHLGPAAQRVP